MKTGVGTETLANSFDKSGINKIKTVFYEYGQSKSKGQLQNLFPAISTYRSFSRWRASDRRTLRDDYSTGSGRGYEPWKLLVLT